MTPMTRTGVRVAASMTTPTEGGRGGGGGAGAPLPRLPAAVPPAGLPPADADGSVRHCERAQESASAAAAVAASATPRRGERRADGGDAQELRSRRGGARHGRQTVPHGRWWTAREAAGRSRAHGGVAWNARGGWRRAMTTRGGGNTSLGSGGRGGRRGRAAKSPVLSRRRATSEVEATSCEVVIQMTREHGPQQNGKHHLPGGPHMCQQSTGSRNWIGVLSPAIPLPGLLADQLPPSRQRSPHRALPPSVAGVPGLCAHCDHRLAHRPPPPLR